MTLDRTVTRAVLLLGFLAACPLSLAAQAPATNEVTLLDADGVTHSGPLQSLTPERVVVLQGGKPQAVPIARLIRIDWKQAPQPQTGSEPLVLLANGDRLAVLPESMDDVALTGRWAAAPNWPRVSIPLETLKGCLVHPPRSAAVRTRLVNRLLDQSEKQDLLVLANGDRATGELTSLDAGGFHLDAAVGPLTMAADGVWAVSFNSDLTSFPKRDGTKALICLADGSRITGDNWSLQENGRFVLHAAYGERLEFPLDHLISLQILGGPALYLSDAEPESYRFQPYLSLAWPLQRDRTAQGGALRLRGREFAKGLGLHSRSEVTYRLDRRDRWFRATLGINDDTRGRGHVICRILLDGKEAYTSGPLTGASEPVLIDKLDLRGAERLTLIVEFGEGGDILDHADWGDAMLVR